MIKLRIIVLFSLLISSSTIIFGMHKQKHEMEKNGSVVIKNDSSEHNMFVYNNTQLDKHTQACIVGPQKEITVFSSQASGFLLDSLEAKEYAKGLLAEMYKKNEQINVQILAMVIDYPFLLNPDRTGIISNKIRDTKIEAKDDIFVCISETIQEYTSPTMQRVFPTKEILYYYKLKSGNAIEYSFTTGSENRIIHQWRINSTNFEAKIDSFLKQLSNR